MPAIHGPGLPGMPFVETVRLACRVSVAYRTPAVVEATAFRPERKTIICFPSVFAPGFPYLLAAQKKA